MRYLDFGGRGPTLVALHGSFGRGAIFTRMAVELAGAARVVAPDQRDHGRHPHPGPFRLEDFIADAADFIRDLDAGPVVLFGHSLGGITAYRLAAQDPNLVRALIVEDVGPVMRRPEIEQPILDVRGWPRAAPTRAELSEAIRARGVPDAGYFMQSAERDGDGYRLLFDWEQMMAVQEGAIGDWWSDWLGSSVPALVLRGGHSTLLPAGLARDMVARRPGARLVEFPDAGHWIHDDEPVAMARAVAAFLAEQK